MNPDEHPADIEVTAEVYLVSRLTPAFTSRPPWRNKAVMMAALVLIALAVGALGVLTMLVSPEG